MQDRPVTSLKTSVNAARITIMIHYVFWSYQRVFKCGGHGGRGTRRLFGHSRTILTVNEQIWNKICKRAKLLFVEL